MKKTIAIILLLLIAFAGAWYWSIYTDQQEIHDVQVLSPPEIVPEVEPPPAEFPIEEIEVPLQPEPEPPPLPLPSLEDSDTEIINHLDAMLGAEALDKFFVLELVISRMVATIDSLPSAQVAPLMLPVKPAPGKFTVLSAEDEAVVSPQNAERYAPYVDMLAAADMDEVVNLYVRYYPLFQEAYRALGYPDGHFNDRLVEVIDHLLETPEPAGLLNVTQVEAVYEFNDPELESLSAGQKTLLRMGEDNARIAKGRLRELRAALSGINGGT